MKEFDFNINGMSYHTRITGFEDSKICIDVNGTPYDVFFENKIQKTPVIKTNPVINSVLETNTLTNTDSGNSIGTIKSPLPGLVIKINCSVGQEVSMGHTLLVLEAMKMQNEIQSPGHGVVKEIKVKEGENILEGDKLIIIE